MGTALPNYENVCSNILGFYFDPTEAHGMRDLLLREIIIVHVAWTRTSILLTDFGAGASDAADVLIRFGHEFA